MPEVLLFVEDSAQEKFLSALLKRMATERSVPLTIRIRTARGGLAKVLAQLENYAGRGRERGAFDCRKDW